MAINFFKEIVKVLVIISFFVNIISCLNIPNVDTETQDNPMINIDTETRDNPMIYVSGIYDFGNISKACYWVNGQKHDLIHPDYSEGQTFAIKVNNGKIYVTGRFKQYPSPPPPYNTGKYQACYWVNGELILLSEEQEESSANDIIISNDTIYIAGACTENNIIKACYWKNNELIMVSDEESWAISIFIKNDIVYMGGYTGDPMDTYKVKPCYWINGEKRELPGFGAVTFIGEHEGELIVAGFYDDYSDNSRTRTRSCRWLEDKIIFGAGTINRSSNSVYVFNNNIYSAGNYPAQVVTGIDVLQACYFINEDRIMLPSAWQYSHAESIVVYENKIYTAGENGLSGDQNACYWVDNIRYDLPGQNSKAHSIFVKK